MLVEASLACCFICVHCVFLRVSFVTFLISASLTANLGFDFAFSLICSDALSVFMQRFFPLLSQCIGTEFSGSSSDQNTCFLCTGTMQGLWASSHDASIVFVFSVIRKKMFFEKILCFYWTAGFIVTWSRHACVL